MNVNNLNLNKYIGYEYIANQHWLTENDRHFIILKTGSFFRPNKTMKFMNNDVNRDTIRRIIRALDKHFYSETPPAEKPVTKDDIFKELKAKLIQQESEDSGLFLSHVVDGVEINFGLNYRMNDKSVSGKDTITILEHQIAQLESQVEELQKGKVA